MSGQNPIISAVASLAKHACLRSLSCEISRVCMFKVPDPIFISIEGKETKRLICLFFRNQKTTQRSQCFLVTLTEVMCSLWHSASKTLKGEVLEEITAFAFCR